jgi:hypothetical protein
MFADDKHESDEDEDKEDNDEDNRGDVLWLLWFARLSVESCPGAATGSSAA